MKKRLDIILMERKLFPSREKARAAVMTGRILIGGKKETKAGTMLADDVKIEIIGDDPPFVSRGGLKLEKAVKRFGLDFTGKTVIPFCTSTSSGLGDSGTNLEKMAGTGAWLEGRRFSENPSEDSVREWVRGLDLE